MPKKRLDEHQTTARTRLDSFEQHVESALLNFNNPLKLGSESLLAAPYFLGRALDDDTTSFSAEQRGRVLQGVLKAATQTLPPEQRKLLDVAYYQRQQALNNLGLAMALNIPERTFYRRKDEAIKRLAEAVIGKVAPPLCLEPIASRQIVGRSHLIQTVQSELERRRSISIIGTGGIGKTTFAAAVAMFWAANGQSPRGAGSERQAPPSRVFWYTVRSGFNDQLGSIAFAFGAFLRSLGVANTWRQMVADQGKIRVDRLLSLIRYDLSQLSEQRILLCIDEVDLLRLEQDDHLQIVHLLEELSMLVPTILIGQRAIMRTDVNVVLDPLARADIEHLLKLEGYLSFDEALFDKIMHATNGNTALIMLVAAFHRLGGDVRALLTQVSTSTSAEVLFDRIWRHLTEVERAIMMQLAVFRVDAPTHMWPEHHIELEHLESSSLVVASQGGLRLIDHVQHFALEKVPSELRSDLHLRAAQTLDSSGEYTEAIFHYIEAQQLSMAVWLWMAHRRIEIERGRIFSALVQLRRINADAMPNDRDRAVLLAARGSLLEIVGKSEEAEADLDAVARSEHPLLLAFARTYLGNSLESQGRLQQALETYRSGITAIVGSLEYQKARLHSKLSYLQLNRMSDISAARQEAIAAQLEAMIIRGSVEDRAGNYETARALYEAAMELAEPLEGLLLEKSRLFSYLGILCWKQGDLDRAITLLERGNAIHQMRGDLSAEAFGQINIAAAHIQAGRHDLALTEALNGMKIATYLNNKGITANLASAAAEACYYLGRFDDAEQYAWSALTQEEEYARSYALVVLGLVRRVQHKYTEAAELMQQAIQSAQDADDLYAEAAAWRALGDTHRDAQHPEQAREAYASSLVIYERLELPKEISELKHLLAAVE